VNADFWKLKNELDNGNLLNPLSQKKDCRRRKGQLFIKQAIGVSYVDRSKAIEKP